MLILTCCYFFFLFLCCHTTLPKKCSGSVSQLSLQPCDLISLTDCGCLGKVSLSPRSPFSSSLRSLWQTHSGILSKSSALCWTALRGLFTLAHKPTQRLSAQSLQRTCHTQGTHAHTQVHAGINTNTIIWEDINTHKMQLKRRTHSIPQAHILYLTAHSPR